MSDTMHIKLKVVERDKEDHDRMIKASVHHKDTDNCKVINRGKGDWWGGRRR